MTDAPISVGRTFLADESLTTMRFAGFTGEGTSWDETRHAGTRVKTITVLFDLVGHVSTLGFFSIGPEGGGRWGYKPIAGGCSGVTVNRTVGSATFRNVALRSADPSSSRNSGPITLNGTLTFTPF